MTVSTGIRARPGGRCARSRGDCRTTRRTARPSRVRSSWSHHISMSLLDTSYLSPTEANDETPMPSRENCSSSAMPTPPDWTTRPATPGRGGRAAKDAQARAGHDDAQAVRADQAHAVPAAGGQQVSARRARDRK